MRKIKVLIIDQTGVLASERKKYEELSRFQDLAITVLVPKQWRFNFRQFNFEEGPKRQYKIIPLPVAFPGYGHRSFFLNSFRKILKNLQPDFIHLFQEPYSFFAGQTVLARNLFLPKAKIIFITWQNLYFENYPFVFSKLYSFIEKRTFKNSICATPITQSAHQVLTKKGFRNKSHVLNWGINLDFFKKQDPDELRKQLHIEDRFVVGYAGRFVEEKGILDLLKATAPLDDDIALLLVGDGPIKPEIENLARESNIKNRVIIVNSLSNSEMSLYINCMDVLVLPSRDCKYWKEQLGKVILEAMACEVPVVGSDSGEIPYVINDSGMIFKSGNYLELRDKISLIKSNGNDIQQLIRKAKERVHAIYSWKTIAKNLHNLYGELMQTPPMHSINFKK